MFAYYLQYSLLNYNIFFSYHDNIKHTVGLIVEMMPITVTGLILKSINLIEKLRIIRKQSLLLIFIIFILILHIDFIIRPGIIINIGAILLFSFFGIMLINEKLNKNIIVIISNITKYTGGVYYLHTVVRNIIIEKISLVKNRNYFGAIIIYILCFLVCLIGNKILGKTELKYLFY